MLSDVGSESSTSHGNGSMVENIVALSVCPLQSYPTRADVVVTEAKNTKAGSMLLVLLLLLE